jgi:imidazolonepropionase-like amidohydrolase
MTGTTTVRDVGGDFNTVIATRDAINNDTVDGPRIFTSGKILTPTENGNSFFPTWYVEADGPAEVRKACRAEFQQGADFIKVMGSGAMMNPGGIPGITIVEEDELMEAVKIAKSKDSYVAVHCHGAESIKLAAKCGVRTIEHGSFIDDEGIELLKNSESYIIPTLFVVKTLTDDVADGAEFMKPKIEALISKEIACLKKAYSAGLKIGWGTDVDVDSFIENPGMEFILRKEWLEMKEIDILLQATKHSAEIIKCGDKLGTVKEGKYADLIVVDGDPLKNIELMNTGIVHVFKEGKQYK